MLYSPFTLAMRHSPCSDFRNRAETVSTCRILYRQLQVSVTIVMLILTLGCRMFQAIYAFNKSPATSSKRSFAYKFNAQIVLYFFHTKTIHFRQHIIILCNIRTSKRRGHTPDSEHARVAHQSANLQPAHRQYSIQRIPLALHTCRTKTPRHVP